MGFLKSLFGGPTGQLESELVRLYTTTFVATGFPRDQARAQARLLLERAKKMGRDQGTCDILPGAGDRMLATEHTKPTIRQILKRARTEGATDADIRWWWNMHDLERCMMLASDDFASYALYSREYDRVIERAGERSDDARIRVLREENPQLIAEACQRASRVVRRAHPHFGDPKDQSHTSGDDSPLPFELKDRVSKWIMRRSGEPDFEQVRQSYPTMNALIRAEMRTGSL